MATAAEILAALDEAYIVIGDDRHITIPANLKRLAVQFDHNIETVTFKCPRYWDNHDMSKMAIYVNYMRSDGYKDRYPVDNVKVEGDVMFFDWTISRNVTQVKGNISFLICVMKTDAEGNEERHWNSELSQEAYVSEGMECEESPVDMYPDLVTQLLLRMSTVEQINVQADEMQALYEATVEVANTAEEVKNQALDASGEIRNSYAPAIKSNIAGEIIRVEDVSPIEHDVKCWVHGKNLFNMNDYVTETDYGNDNKTIYAINADHLVVGRTYTVFSSVPMRWFKISNSAIGYSCCGKDGGTTGFTSLTFVHKRDANILETAQLHMYIDNVDKTAMYDLSIMKTMNVCLVEGPVATEYEPYLDPTTVKLTRCKRNIFNIGTVYDYQRIGDMRIEGQSIQCTVTSSNSSHVVNTTNKYPSGVYSLRFDYSDSMPRILLRLYNKDGSVITSNEVLRQDGYQYNDAYQGFFKNGREMIMTISDDVAYWCLGFVFPVTDTAPVGSVENVYGIRLEYGDGTNKFEMYDGETIVPESDGTCVVTSKFPIMTLFTDTPGVIIEAKYNADTKTWIENLPGVSDEQIESVVEGYLEENPIDVIVDTTLSKSGAAADAKAVGDQLGSIETALDSIIAIQEELIGGDET